MVPPYLTDVGPEMATLTVWVLELDVLEELVFGVEETVVDEVFPPFPLQEATSKLTIAKVKMDKCFFIFTSYLKTFFFLMILFVIASVLPFPHYEDQFNININISTEDVN